MLARALWLTLVASSFAFSGVPSVCAQDGSVEQGEDEKDEDGKDEDGKGEDEKGEDEKGEDEKGEDEKGANPADPKKKAEPKRPIDTESPEAQALVELLHVAPKYGKKDKRVELEYNFGEPAQVEDFSVQGFDRVEPGSGLELTAGSQRAGLILHALNMKGEYEIEFVCVVEWMAPSSQVVFLVGDGKSGALWGNGWCKRTSRGYKPVSSKIARLVDESRSKFNGAREVKIRLKVGSGEISCLINGVKAGDTKRLKKLDGRIGIYVKNIRLRVNRVSIMGEIDASKL